MHLLESTLAAIRPASAASAEAARARQDELTKPRGSLGKLETLSIRIAAMRGTDRPRLGPGAIFVMAADHGVAAEGVSLYPPEVTAQMVANFLAGGAAISVLSRAAGVRVVTADLGVAVPIPPAPGLWARKIRLGSSNIARGPAMSMEEARKALETGIEIFETEYAALPFGIAATGDMGIGNTTPSAAVASVLTGLSPRDIVGRGTGLDDEGLARKLAVVEKALEVNKPYARDGIAVLAALGGFEIGAIAGVCLAAAARRLPVVIDGFISTAGALVAASLAPDARDFMIAAHASSERGHRAMLSHLGLEPLLDLDLRLGEGTGAALAIPICQAACRVLDEMATFSEAGVSDKA